MVRGSRNCVTLDESLLGCYWFWIVSAFRVRRAFCQMARSSREAMDTTTDQFTERSDRSGRIKRLADSLTRSQGARVTWCTSGEAGRKAKQGGEIVGLQEPDHSGNPAFLNPSATQAKCSG